MICVMFRCMVIEHRWRTQEFHRNRSRTWRIRDTTLLRCEPFPFRCSRKLRFGIGDQRWREDLRSGYDYEAGILVRNPKLMWFNIARSEGFFATIAESIDVCLSDMYYTDEMDGIPSQATQISKPVSNRDEEHQSEVDEFCESSSSESYEETSVTELPKDWRLRKSVGR